jgi:hypothetical protein
LWTKYNSYLGVNKARAEELMKKIIAVTFNLAMFHEAERCGTSYAEYCANISEIVLGEDCQCVVSDTTLSTEVIPLALQTTPSVSGCDITFGTAAAGLPGTPTTGDTHFFTTTAGLYNQYDVYWYNGSAWVYQYNIKGATGAAGAVGATGGDGADGVSVIYSSISNSNTPNLAYTGLKTSGTLTDLSANGDEYEVSALFSTSALAKVPDTVKFTIDGIDMTFNYLPNIAGTPVIEKPFYGLTKNIRIDARIVVTDYAAKTAHIFVTTYYIDSYSNVIDASEAVCYVITTSALNSIVINAMGKVGGTGTVACESLIVTFKNKI